MKQIRPCGHGWPNDTLGGAALQFAPKMEPIEVLFIGGPNDGGIVRLFYLPDHLFWTNRGLQHKYVRQGDSLSYHYDGAFVNNDNWH